MNKTLKKALTGALALVGAIALTVTPMVAANATVVACIPSEGVAAYDEIVTAAYDDPATDLWYSWTGGQSDSHAFPGSDWQVDNGNHNGFDQALGLLERPLGNSGNSAWFYHASVPGAHHDAVIVHHDAVPPVVCDPEDEPVLEVGGYCYDLLNAENPAAWENSGLQTFAAKKAGIEDWTTAEKLALCGLTPESCDPVTIGFQSDWVSTEDGFEFPEHIQYPTDNIGWPPIYNAVHEKLTQTQSDEATCNPPEIVQFSAPTFNVPEQCDREGGIVTQEIRGVIWTIVFDAVSGNYTVDAAPDVANNFAFAAEVQTHWEGNVGAVTPCPTIERCETNTVNPAATNLDPRGWDFEGAEWTEDGLVFTASNWSDSYAHRATNFKLSQVGGLDLDLDIDGSGVWAIILQTASGNIHYEPTPYSLDFWTNAPGILPASPGGQGGNFAGDLDDIIGDPTITGVYLYFSTGSEEPVSALLSSGSYNCLVQPFAAAAVEEPPVVTPPVTTPTALPVTGVNPIGVGLIALAILGLGGLLFLFNKVWAANHQPVGSHVKK